MYFQKKESIKAKIPQLQQEAKIYENLQGQVGIPNLYWQGKNGDFNVMVIELLGPSLEDLFQFCGKRFSVKTVLMIIEQIISRIEFIHSKNYIYRDIKPDNFLIGINKKADHIYLIDYGLAKRFRDPKLGQHIEYKDGKPFIGTVRYSSINTHQGIEQSRRDDLEAIGYVLMYFLRGYLPWQGIKAENKKNEEDKIGEIKMNTSLEELCQGFPNEFASYVNYTRNLKFEEKPDYNWIKQQFRQLFYRMEYQKDQIFDWQKLSSQNACKKKLIETEKEDKQKSETQNKHSQNDIYQENEDTPIYKSNKQISLPNQIEQDSNSFKIEIKHSQKINNTNGANQNKLDLGKKGYQNNLIHNLQKQNSVRMVSNSLNRNKINSGNTSSAICKTNSSFQGSVKNTEKYSPIPQNTTSIFQKSTENFLKKKESNLKTQNAINSK